MGFVLEFFWTPLPTLLLLLCLLQEISSLLPLLPSKLPVPLHAIELLLRLKTSTVVFIFPMNALDRITGSEIKSSATSRPTAGENNVKTHIGTRTAKVLCMGGHLRV